MRRVIFGLALVAVMTTWKPTPVATAPPREAAADMLAAQGKLFCHRSFRATAWTPVPAGGGNIHEVDQDTTDKLICGYQSPGDNFISLYQATGPNDVGTGLNGVPTYRVFGGQAAAIVVETPPAAETCPTCTNQSQLTGRIGYRWYFHLSDSDTCEGAKFVQVGLYWSSNDPVNSGLIWQGNGYGISGLNTKMMRNKWTRVEGYFDSYLNPTSHTIYFKTDIANNGPEFSSTQTDGLEPGGNYRRFLSGFTHWIHMYRDQRAVPGSCTNQFSHLLVAKNLGPGERIAPAAELETGATVGKPPDAPRGLTTR